MARVLKKKELLHTRLATNYGGWFYCSECNKNIGYLCYVTYNKFELDYVCQCGSKGHMLLEFIDSIPTHASKETLLSVKNRLCCSHDMDPLVTILSEKLKNYQLKISCKNCGAEYQQKEA